MEHLAVIFGTSIQLRDGLLQLTQRDATAIVADADFLFCFVNPNFYLPTEARGELIDGVVNHFFDQHIDAVILRGTVAEFADIHTRTATDVLHVLKMDNAVVIIVFSGRNRVAILREDVAFVDFAHKSGFGCKGTKKTSENTFNGCFNPFPIFAIWNQMIQMAIRVFVEDNPMVYKQRCVSQRSGDGGTSDAQYRDQNKG